MRTVDPETWYVSGNKSQDATARKVFGSQSMSRIERRLRSSFADAMEELWAHSSTAGIKYMRNKNSCGFVRCCYILSILILTTCSLLVLWQDWRTYRTEAPLVVNLYSMQHPIEHVDFPAVAICSYNVISKKALKEYANYLYSLDRNRTYPLKTIEKNLLTFGALQTWSNPPVDVMFMQYLARVGRQTNVTNILLRLAPQCSSFLHRCSWRTARVPCDRLFATRATPHGYCCVFNSRYQPEDLHNPVQKLNFVGQDGGLLLLVKENASDVAFLRGPGDGVEVLLFDGSEYPLIVGGSSNVYLTQRNASIFLRLNVKAQFTAPSLQYYSEKWRGCRMRDAHSENVDQRSQAWCLAHCRRQAIQVLCGCVPHLLFPQPADVVCSPDRLACLNKHKEKFMYFYPGEGAAASLPEEASDSLDCEHCAPDCSRLGYFATVSRADHQYSHKLFLNMFVKGASLLNSTVIRIFYASKDQQLYIVEANLRWYEVVAAIGCRWLCLVTLSCVSMMELAYHITIRWRHHYKLR